MEKETPGIGRDHELKEAKKEVEVKPITSNQPLSPVQVKELEQAQKIDELSEQLDQVNQDKKQLGDKLELSLVENQTLTEALNKKKEEIMGAYTFIERVVPPFNETMTAQSGTKVLVDDASNSWSWIATEEEGKSLVALAKSLDKRVQELDLDFSIVTVSAEHIRAAGLQAVFGPGLAEHTTSSLGFSTLQGSLALGNFNLKFDAQALAARSSVISTPLVRTEVAKPFRFSSAREVPIRTSTVSEGVVRDSIEYREIGLVFSGNTRTIGERLHLELLIENGTIVEDNERDVPAPTFQTQKATVNGSLEWHRWSLYAALRVDAESIKSGIFSRSNSKNSDLLLVFVRPRFQLYNPPMAKPVNLQTDYDEWLLNTDSKLLPPVNWDKNQSALPVLPQK